MTAADAVEFLAPWPGWAAMVWLALSAAVVIVLYRREAGIRSARARRCLAAVRLATLVLFALFLWEPVWVEEEARPGSRSVVVLVDESESMGVADAVDPVPRPGGEGALVPRIEAARRFLADGHFLASLPGSPRTVVMGFAERVRFLGSADAASARAAGAATALGDALREVLAASDGTLAAVFLVTDGRVTRGADPVAAAREAFARGVRVFPIGVGDPEGFRDIAVDEIVVNDVVLAGDIARVTARLRARRLAGTSVRAVLSEDGVPAAEAVVTLADGEQRVRFLHKMERPGRRVLSVRVDPVPGEVTARNNEASRAVEVIDAKIKVLLADGYPRWDFQYLRNALKRDPVVAVSVLQEDADPDFFPEGTLPIGRFPETLADLSAYDVVVLGDVSREFLGAAALEALVRFVQDRAGGIVFVAGRRNGSPQVFRDTPLERLLPVALWDDAAAPGRFAAGMTGTEPWRWRRAPEGAAGDATDLAVGTEDTDAVWRGLPGLFWAAPLAGTKPLAATLLEGEGPAGETVPLLVSHYAGAGRAALLATDETWRWRAGVGDRLFHRFWGALLRDLSRNRFYGQGSRYRLDTGGRRQFAVGETIPLRAWAFEADGAPVSWETAEVIRPRGEREPERVTLERDPATPGGFAGGYVPTEPGPYEFALMAGGRPEAAVTCEVVPPQVEWRDPGLDEELLSAVAAAGHGRYRRLAEAAVGSVAFDLGEPLAVVARTERPAWRHLAVYLLAVGLLTLEWVLRRANRAL